MFSLRGDAHKLYLRLKKASGENESLDQMKGLAEIQEIQGFYEKIDSATLQRIFYRMTKEKNGSGIIPVFVTAIPWLLFLFSDPLQKFLFSKGTLLWAVFVLIYLSILTVSVILHFHEKSWAAVHTEIIQDILKVREGNRSGS